ATLLSDDAIKEIRESRGRISNASKKMADKFHIGPKRVYEIWNNKERLQQRAILSQPVNESILPEMAPFFLVSSKKENLVNELILPSCDLSRE
ncbi:5601_t:CDS:1, partial [Racocetra persica]